MTNPIKTVILELLRATPIAGDFDRTRAMYANEALIDKICTSIASIVEGMKKIPYCIENKGAVRDCQIYNQVISDIAKMIRGVSQEKG